MTEAVIQGAGRAGVHPHLSFAGGLVGLAGPTGVGVVLARVSLHLDGHRPVCLRGEDVDAVLPAGNGGDTVDMPSRTSEVGDQLGLHHRFRLIVVRARVGNSEAGTNLRWQFSDEQDARAMVDKLLNAAGQGDWRDISRTSPADHAS